MGKDVIDPNESAKYIRSLLADEVKFRRDRRQQIFAWASSLLIAIIGGSTALSFTKQSTDAQQPPQHQNDAQQLTQLHRSQSWALAAAPLILGVFSMIWVQFHYRAEGKFKRSLQALDEKLPDYDKIPSDLYKKYPADWTTLGAILLLTLAALGAVFLNLAPQVLPLLWPPLRALL